MVRLRQWGHNVFVKPLDDKGDVELWKNQKSRKNMVFKIVPRDRHGTQERDIMLELRDSSSFKYENIIELLYHEEQWTENTMMLRLPYYPDGDLHNWAGCRSRNTGIHEYLLWDAFQQLSASIWFLHNRETPILHLDIKPENIFVSSQIGADGYEVVKFVLADFGLAEYRSEKLCRQPMYHGTRGYLPPENYPSMVHDVWQVGASIHYCALGTSPVDKNADVVPPMTQKEYMRLFDPYHTGDKHLADLNSYKRTNPRKFQTQKWRDRYSSALFDMVGYTLILDPKVRPLSADLPSLVKSKRREWEDSQRH